MRIQANEILLTAIFLALGFFALNSCGGGSGSSSASRPSPTTVFMWPSTTAASSGGFGGVAGGDTICRNDASGITFSGATPSSHRAALITSTGNPSTYFANSPTVKRPDGTTIINSYANFWDSSHSTAVGVTGVLQLYWTGTTTNNCDDWTSSSGSVTGRLGSANSTGINRYNSSQANCNNAFQSVLCISY